MFFNIAKMKFLAAEGLEAPQKTMFFNTTSKIHRKLQVVREARGRRQGRQRVTTEGLRQGHALARGRRPDLKAYA